MWRVDTNKIKSYLSLNDEFVSDLFTWIKQNKDNKKDELETIMNNDKSKFGIVMNALGVLRENVISLTLQPDIDNVIEQYEKMTSDYFNFIGNGAILTLFSQKTNELVKSIFGYLYNDLINRTSYKDNYLQGITYASKSAIRTEIGRIIPVCPYCDSNNIAFNKESNSDHFLAYTHFPLLSVHWENLVLSCLGCNLFIKNDVFIGTKNGVAENIPIYHPYFDEIAPHMRFEFDDKLNVTINTFSNTKAENYINLFELKKKYSGVSDQQAAWYEINANIKREYLDRKGFNKNIDETLLIELYVKNIESKVSTAHEFKGQLERTKLILDFLSFKMMQSQRNKEVKFLKYELEEIIDRKLKTEESIDL